jgi:putative transposase
MRRPDPLVPGQYYHIYNRGNSGETLFLEPRNYQYFLRLYGKCVDPVAETFAYCLLNNHFHFLVRLRDEDEGVSSHSRALANLFSTYTKAFNKAYDRTGSLFEKPFKRKRVHSDSYLAHLVVYIHFNPQKHGFVDDFRDWTHSSYRALVSTQATRLQRDDVLDWFQGNSGLVQAHLMAPDERLIAPLVAGDWPL